MKTDNLQDNLWAWVYAPGFKGHYCPRKLTTALVIEMKTRMDQAGVSEEYPIEVHPRAVGWIDLPGMVMTDRPVEKIRIDTFELEIPSQDFSEFLRELESVELRKFSDGQEYYKIHAYRACVVFTPEQRELVLERMKQMLPLVEERADKADRDFSARIEHLNKDRVQVVSHRDKHSIYAPKRVSLGKPRGDGDN